MEGTFPAPFARGLCLVVFWAGVLSAAPAPYAEQTRAFAGTLAEAADPADRARAAEALGYLRAYRAEEALRRALARDVDPAVRRNAAVALAACGSRPSLPALAQALDDPDWTVRQSAHIALGNLTGQDACGNGMMEEWSDGDVALGKPTGKTFDALAADARESATTWRGWLAALPASGLPLGVARSIASTNHADAARGLRAAGALGFGNDLCPLVVSGISQWEAVADETDADAKIRVQAGLRALGRSGLPAALPVLTNFLQNAQWARYAADALGDWADGASGEHALPAVALLDVFERHARRLTDTALARETSIRAPATHPSDVPHLDARDRILAVPYAVLFSLSRIPFERDPALAARVNGLAPLIAMQLPLDIDRLVMYEEEPFQRIFRSVLERAGAACGLTEQAFAALERPAADEAPASPAAAAAQSGILRGGDDPALLSCDVTGWTDLWLFVDTVDDYFQDRANWADAKLTDAAGQTVWLDTLTPVSSEQAHDALTLNRSAVFPDLRIGSQRFARGLHTHARSVIRYDLGGRFTRFSARVGVCASRAKGKGSVRFSVLREAPPAAAPDRALPRNPAFNSNLLLALCRDPAALPRVVPLLDHTNGWVRINAAKTLMFIGDARAVPAVRERLAASKREGDHGEFAPPPHIERAQGQDEFNDPSPRYREAFVMALGWFRDAASAPLLARVMDDDLNALGIRHRAALALGRIGTPDAFDALRGAERDHPFHSVRMAAREALWRCGVAPLPRPPEPEVAAPRVEPADIPARAARFVFIKGDVLPDNNPFQMDSWRQAYMTTDSGPTYRPGRNLYTLDLSGGQTNAAPLTRFADGYVADCEVSYDSRIVWFARRTQASPWWHLFRIGADGSGLRQVTDGPYHDVQPVELPSGRIAFSSTRLGTRDEYHGYLATGLATMTPDGRDIQVVGFNFGRDAEPAVADDGRILFTRLELFYSRMKTEFNLLAVYPDGTRAQTLYGPERRAFWRGIHGGYGGWFAGGLEGGRHRVLRLTQPQPFSENEVLLTTPAGPVLTQGRQGERLLRGKFLRPGGNDEWVVTTATRLDARTLLVAAGRKNKVVEKAQFPKDPVALGLCTLDVETGELTPLYADPEASCFEARPLHPRAVPPVLTEEPAARGSGFTATLFCQSVFLTREPRVRRDGRFLRVVEGLPQVTRHATQTIPGEFAWKNHGGAFGRDLGTFPLAADGSFAVEVPADRFLHLQVLDADRNVVGNQLVWMNARPGERKGCVGCHEPPDIPAPVRPSACMKILGSGSVPRALPGGEPFSYHAKVWFKGSLPDEREERQRTVQAANWLARP
jgi:HEAT repeat protein